MMSERYESQRKGPLRASSGPACSASGGLLHWADDLPENVDPKASLGDLIEPDWQQRPTITVGHKEADLVGSTDRVLQAAVDYIARQGGGTVRILPGVYRLRNSVFLQSQVRLVGSGADSLLVKEPSVTTRLIADAEHWTQEITLADPSGFRVGDGVRLVGKDPHHHGTNVIQRTLTAASGNRFKLDRYLGQNLFLDGAPQVATNFALLQCTGVVGAEVEQVALDGNRANNEMVDRGQFDDGSIRVDECNRVAIRGVIVHDFYCDGIVWLTSHDVLVEDCYVYDGDRLAIHAGSGSQRSVVRGNRVRRCEEGVYFCWGAQHGLYEKNVIEGCSYGMTLGHSDSDNLIRDNDIRASVEAGISFRHDGKSRAFAPHRNRFERNRIADSGGEGGVAIQIEGEVESVAVIGNELLETRQPLSRIGILVGAETRDIRYTDNRIEGFAIAVKDLRTGSSPPQ